MEKSGFYCIKCNSIPLIQIVPKIQEIKLFITCKCNKKLINYDAFLKNYYVKNLNYENISSSPILTENLDEKCVDQNKNIDIEKIKKNFYNIQEIVNKHILEIKNEAIELLENKIKEVKQSYEINLKNNQKIKHIIEIFLNNYNSNNKNDSNIKNLIHNTNFNFGYLNNTTYKLKFDSSISLGNLLQNVVDYIEKTYIISSYKDQLYTFKKFYNHSNDVTCLIEVSPERIASCSKDSYINIYNLETKKPLYKYVAHNNGVNWIDKIYKNNIISCGEDLSIKIWPNPHLNYEDVKKEDYYNITYAKILEINPLMTFNINEKIFKFIFVKENQICMFAKNKIFLLKYELIFDDKNEGNLLNVNIYIIKEILLNENPFLDSLKFKNHKNQEFIFMLGAKKISIFSLDDLSLFYEFNEYNNNSNCNCLTQLNKDEIIYCNGSVIKIFNINNFKIKFTYKNSKHITFLKKLKDNTLLICTNEGILRIELNHFEEISLIDMIYSNYNNYYIVNRQIEKITYIYEFEDGRLGICSSFGNIKICKFLLA